MSAHHSEILEEFPRCLIDLHLAALPWVPGYLSEPQYYVQILDPAIACKQILLININGATRKVIFIAEILRFTVTITRWFYEQNWFFYKHKIPSSTLLNLQGEVASIPSLSGNCELVQSCLSSTREMSVFQCRPNCTIMCLEFCTRQTDCVECGLFSFMHHLGRPQYVWNEYNKMMMKLSASS